MVQELVALALLIPDIVELLLQFGYKHPELPGLNARGFQFAGIPLAAEAKRAISLGELACQRSPNLFELGDALGPSCQLSLEPVNDLLAPVMVSDFGDNIAGAFDKSQNTLLRNRMHPRHAPLSAARRQGFQTKDRQALLCSLHHSNRLDYQ
jgi:hypothetical protein